MAQIKTNQYSIADDAITLAKMASGTDGNIITYDASGNPAVVASGTAGHFLKSQGADTVPVFAAHPVTSAFTSGLASDQEMSSSVKLEFVSDATLFQNIDVNSDFDDANNRFVAPVTGLYVFHVSGYELTADQNFDGFHLYVNGARKVNPTFSTVDVGGNQTSGGTVMYKLEANDYAEIYGGISGTLTLKANQYHTYWMGYLLGEM